MCSQFQQFHWPMTTDASVAQWNYRNAEHIWWCPNLRWSHFNYDIGPWSTRIWFGEVIMTTNTSKAANDISQLVLIDTMCSHANLYNRGLAWIYRLPPDIWFEPVYPTLKMALCSPFSKCCHQLIVITMITNNDYPSKTNGMWSYFFWMHLNSPPYLWDHTSYARPLYVHVDQCDLSILNYKQELATLWHNVPDITNYNMFTYRKSQNCSEKEVYKDILKALHSDLQ